MLCALFMWLSILFYHKSVIAERSLTKWKNMVICIAFITISMFCKETGITAIVKKHLFFLFPLIHKEIMNNLFKFRTKKQEQLNFAMFKLAFSLHKVIHFKGVCSIYDLVVVNKVLPVKVTKFRRSDYSTTHVNRFLLPKYKNLVMRMTILCATAFALLLLRFSIMGFSTPTFQPVDNPASFAERFLDRVSRCC